MSNPDSAQLAVELEENPRRDELARLVRTVALSAADEQRSRFSDGLDELIEAAELEQEQGEIADFNVLKALSRAEPPVAIGRRLLSLLLARGIALEPPADEVAADRLAKRLCWLAANSYLDALPSLDAALGEQDGERLWQALAAVVSRADERGSPSGRGAALAACAALATSANATAQAARSKLVDELRDPLLRAPLSHPAAAEDAGSDNDAAAGEPEVVLRGALVPAPLGPIGLLLWTITGLIVVRYLLRFVANVLLRRKRPVDVRVAGSGITFSSSLMLLGRKLRTTETHIPLDNLSRAMRVVRYPRLGLYAGLIALVVGTFIGITLATDGGRAGSPSLLALGAGVFGGGLLLDLLFANLLPGKRGRHRLVFVPRKGRIVALATTDSDAADRALRSLSR